MKIRVVISVILSAVLFSACRKNVGPEPVGPIEWPECFKALMSAYDRGEIFRTADVTASELTVVFESGQSVGLDRSQVRVVDCRFRDVPAIVVRDGIWYVNGVNTGVGDDGTCDLSDSQPVCVYFDESRVVMVMSNHMQLAIRDKASYAVSSFVFKAELNPELDRDIECTISGTQISAVLDRTPVSYVLVPTIETKAAKVTVDGVEQHSGASSQDFASPVKYVLALSDGSSIEYTVSVSSPIDFPTVYITTEDGSDIRSKEVYSNGTVRFEDPLRVYSDVTAFEAPTRVRGRGNTTWTMFDKKPYRIKLDEKAKVFGQPKNKDWVLLANYSDKTLLRNIACMEISRIVGMTWTPVMYSVDVYLNGKYRGVYTFADQVEVGKNRINITVAGPEDVSGEALTGDYLFELESSMDEITCFRSSVMGAPVMFKDPDIPQAAQLKYVQDYFTAFEKALKAGNAAEVDNLIDIDSFVNFFIAQELVKNIDGNIRKSTYMTKTRGGKLKMHTLWDFDLALGNCDYFHLNPGCDSSPKGWYVKFYSDRGANTGWYYYLFKNRAFIEKVNRRWDELYPRLKELPAFIDAQAEFISRAQERNFTKWPILNTYVWPNVKVTGSWKGELEYMKSFYNERLEWMNKELKTL